MDLKTYEKYWKKIQPTMLKKMIEIQSHMNSGLEKSGFAFGEIFQGGDEEWSISSVVADANDNVKAILQITLYDSEVNGGTPKGSVGINIAFEGFNATTLVRWCPYNYTEDAFTKEVAEVIRRIELLHALDFANGALDEFNTNELLNKEFAEHLAS
jgi:hypothetical protein